MSDHIALARDHMALAPPTRRRRLAPGDPGDPSDRGDAGRTLWLAARALVRYAVPLALLGALALAPWLIAALTVRPTPDLPGARYALRVAWTLGATAWIGQLLLVGAAAPLVRSLDEGAPLSQLRALGRGARQLARAAVPHAAAVAAIALGGLALAVPGLLLLALFSTTAASTQRGVPAPLVESAEIVRRRWPLVACAVGAMLAIDLGAVFIAQVVLRAEVAKKLTLEQLAAYRRIIEIATIALAAAAVPIATVLAAVHARATRAGKVIAKG